MERKPLRQSETISASQFLRVALLASTAFSPFALGVRAQAQTLPAPYTTPQGGVVSAGSASIAQAPGSTTITQTSQRAALDWQSFNVGAQAQVQFVQPSASAIALNRVVSPDPSVIAGRINANGQLVLINQSGVVFTQGSQVNAESVVVSTSNVANKDFMAGHLIFSEPPNPGAKIINDGNITARDAGLVGLVAPQVANNGVITATLGTVVLAGATAFTLDLYGDRLISLDVTKAVTAVDVGGKLVPALVTNSGVIVADGGHITLTAQDADALVTQLIDAGGTLQADSVGSQTGTISIEGVGGNIQIAGNLLARGLTAGTKGGAVEALTTGTVSVAPGAVVDASGNAGGGVIAIGTDRARAQTGQSDTTAPKAAAVSIAPGSVLKADAAATGNGGKVTLLSGQNTDFAGAISVQGGPNGGNGGLAEISSDGVISLSGTVADLAIDGHAGEILLDPATLIVSSTLISNDPGHGTTTFGSLSILGTDTTITPSQLLNLGGNVTLEAADFISVASAILMNDATGLILTSSGSIEISAPIALTAGSLEIDATDFLSINAGLTAENINLSGGVGGISIGAAVNAVGGSVNLTSTGGITEAAGVGITTGTLTGTDSGGDVFLMGTNAITTLGSFLALTNNFTLDDSDPIDITGMVDADNVTLNSSGTISETLPANGEDGGYIVTTGSLTGSSTGDATFGNSTFNQVANLGAFTATAGDFTLEDTGPLDVIGQVTANNGVSATGAGAVDLTSTGAISETGGGIKAGVLTGSAATNAIFNDQANNQVANLDVFTATAGDFTLEDTGPLDVIGQVTANNGVSANGAGAVDLTSTGAISETGGGIKAGVLTGSAATNAIFDDQDNNQVANLGAFTATAGDFTLEDTGPLDVIGQVTANNGVSASSAGTVDLTSTGAISEPSPGGIKAGVLTGSAATNAIFDDQANNQVANLGAFTATAGDFTLEDTGPLSVIGQVTANNGVSATGAGTVDLTSTGAISEPSPGGIKAGVLTGSAATNAIFDDQTNNQVANLGAFTATAGDFTLEDTGPLSVIGQVTANNGVSATGAGTVDLTSTGAISEPSPGGIKAGVLTGSAATDAIFEDQANNDVAQLGTFTAGGDFTLGDEIPLTINGTVTAIDIAINDVAAANSTVPNAITISSLLDATGTLSTPGTLSLTTPNAGIIETLLGTIDTGIITGLADPTDPVHGSASFANTFNSVAQLGTFTAGGDFTLGDEIALTVTGPVKAKDVTLDVSLAASMVPVTAINIAGPITATGITNPEEFNGVVDLIAVNGSIFENLSTGAIITDTLTGSVTDGSAFLVTSGLLSNEVAGLFNFTVSGDDNYLFLNDSERLTAGGVAATGSPGYVGLTAPAITITGGIGATYVELDATDTSIHKSIMEISPDGTIDAAVLSGSAAVNADFYSQGNDVTSLNSFTAGNDFLLNDGVGLIVAGPVTAQNIALIENAPGSNNNITFEGSVVAGSTLNPGSIDLIANQLTPDFGAISAPGGLVDITPYTNHYNIDLGGTNVADLDISQALVNLIDAKVLQIGTAAFTSDGTLYNFAGGTILQEDSLRIPSPTLALNGTAISLAAGGTLVVPTLLTFASAGNVLEDAAAIISVPTLTGTAKTGDISLIGTGNDIQTITSLSALAGGITLNDVPTLSIAGLISTGTMTGDELVLEGSGYTEAGTGSIHTPTLATTGTNVSGNVMLASHNNSIDTLGAFTLGGNLLLDDATSLDIPGLVDGTGSGSSIDINDAESLRLPGTVMAPTVILSAATSIALSGAIDASTLLALGSTGAVSQSGGSINAGSLLSLGTIGGGASLGSSSNNIGTLGAFATVGDLLLADAGNLAVTGPVDATSNINVIDAGALSIPGTVAAPTVSLSANRSIGLSGRINAPTLLELGSAGSISQTAGAINTGLLISLGMIGGDASLGSASNMIGRLGAFALGGNLQLTDASSLDISGPVAAGGNLLLKDTGNLNITGQAAAAGNLLLTDNGNLSITTTGQVDGTGSGSSIDVGDTGVSAISGVVIAPTVSLSAASSMDLSGTIDAVTELALGSGGAVSQTAGGTITAGSLASIGQIGRDVSLGSANNQIGTLGAFALGGNLLLTDARSLDIAGPVAAGGNLVLADTGNLNITGQAAAAGNLLLTDNGNLSITTTGQVDGTGTASNIDVTTAGAFWISGTLSAKTVSLTANGPLTLNNGGALFISGSIAPPNISGPRTGVDSTITSASILQNVVFDINAGPTGATLFLDTSGPIAFAQSPNGLMAPDIDLVIGSATNATGNVNLQHLEVIHAQSVNLTGFLKTKAGVSVTGPAAAANGSVFPTPLPIYKINNCPIESVNCVIIPTVVVPLANPLGNFDLSQRKRKRLYRNVQMPGIATRDY